MKKIISLFSLCFILFFSACSNNVNLKTEKSFTLKEISKFNNINNCVMVIRNNVYNFTKFVSKHPGGKRILNGCGKDATLMFEAQKKHPKGSSNNQKKYKIGILK